jgi:hypothetical protein
LRYLYFLNNRDIFKIQYSTVLATW